MSPMAELSRESCSLRGQEVLGDTHGTHQALNLYQERWAEVKEALLMLSHAPRP